MYSYNYNCHYTTLELQLQLQYTTLYCSHYTTLRYTTLHYTNYIRLQLQLQLQLRYTNYTTENTSASEHFWKLRPWKIARGCGVKHISKSTCAKHTTFRALLEVEMLKKCMPLWCEAHFEVTMLKTPHVRTTFGRQRHDTTTTTTTSTTTWQYNYNYSCRLQLQLRLHCNTLQYATVLYTTLHSTTLHNSHYNGNCSFNYNSNYSTYTTLHYSTLHYSNCITLHYITVQYSTIH